ncbi:phage terminase small subunit [Pseudomonas putida]|uniref:phage terminase small subunit n=1 Tax=Pseudomonas putida TaxID=303 RepID=UPI003D9614C3
MSLALNHKKRLLEQGPAADPKPYTSATALAGPANAQKHLALMNAALAEDCGRLSELNSLEARQRLKRDELLPKYLEYVQRYRDSGLNHPNLVLMQVMVWLFDTEQFEPALELADFAIEQGQAMPERFRRDIPTFVGDTVVEWAEAQHKAQRNPQPYLSQLLLRVDGHWPGHRDPRDGDPRELPPPAASWELFEKIPARYHKLLGILAMEDKRWANACAHFYRANELYPEIGVKTRMDDASKALRKQEAEADRSGTE